MVNCRQCNKEHPDKKSKLFGWTCANCVQMLVDGTAEVHKETTQVPKKKVVITKNGWPMGWHRRKYFVGPDGVTYHRGKPQVIGG